MNKKQEQTLHKHLVRVRPRNTDGLQKYVILTDIEADLPKIMAIAQKYNPPVILEQIGGLDGLPATVDNVRILGRPSVPEVGLVVHTSALMQNSAAYDELLEMLGVFKPELRDFYGNPMTDDIDHCVYGDWSPLEIQEVTT